MSRFTIEFNEESDKGLEAIQSRLGVTSKAEVIRKAVNLLNYVIKERDLGSKLILENSDQKVRKEVITI